MDFDDMLEELGELGRFQITTYTLVCLPVLFAAANSLSYVFTAGVPEYRCLIPECDNPNRPSYNEEWLHWAIPHDDYTIASGYVPHQCDRYVANLTYNPNASMCSPDAFTRDIERCSEWVFTDDERTIVNDWNVTCLENRWKLSLVGTSHFAGIIVGSALFGALADRYGRKLVFIFCILLMSVAGVAQTLSPEYVTFTTLIFVNSLGTAGVYPLAFIIGVEMVGRKKREVTGMILNYFYSIGEALVALIAWLSRDWVVLQLAVSAPPILFVIYYWFVPESVRWLLAKDKNQKAKGIICKVAKINKVVLSESLLESFNVEQSPQMNASPTKSIDPPVSKENSWAIIKTMMGSRKLVIRFAIIYLIWAVNAFIYYGLSVNATSMSGNKYMNFALVSLVEIPGYSLGWIGIRKIGRRASLVMAHMLCALVCTISVLVPQDHVWETITLFLTGKLAITAAFGVVYVHTAEMLPTIIRSGGVGSASTMARVGALLAPFVPLLGIYYAALPMLLFGSVAFIAGLVALKLPETLGTRLPDTAEEAAAL